MPQNKSIAPRTDNLTRALAERETELLRNFVRALDQVPPVETAHLTFALVGGVPVKLAVKVRSSLLRAPDVGISLGQATNTEIEEALSVTKDYEMRVRLRVLLNLIRENEATREPIEIKIVNAGELKSDKILHIKRGDDGKMTGCTVMNAS